MQTDKKDYLYLLDGHALAYRAYYAMIRSNLKATDGTPTGAIHAFCGTVVQLLKEYSPKYIGIVFDTPVPTFRHIAYEKYKIHRKPQPEELTIQIPIIKEIMTKLNIPVFTKDGYEADDILATFALRFSDAKHHAVIVTGDKDLFQIAGDNVHIMMPSKTGVGFNLFSPDEIYAKYGYHPHQVVEYKAIAGDTSDGIPGVSGIGEKGALKLLSEYGSLEKIYENINKIANKKAHNALIESKEMAFVSKDLATIETKVPIDATLDQFIFKPSSDGELAAIFHRLGLKRTPLDLTKVVKEKYDIDVDYQHPDAKNIEKSSYTLTHTKPEKQLPLKSHIIYTKDELHDLIAKLKKADIIAIDLETDSIDTLKANIVGIALSTDDTDGYYIPLLHKTGEGMFKEVDDRQLKADLVISELKPILEKHKCIAHNAKFEYTILHRYGIDLNIHDDTILASYVDNPEISHGLKNLSREVFGHTMTEYTELTGKGKNAVTIDNVSIEKVAPYASADACICYKLHEHYEKELPKELKHILYDIEVPLVKVLSEMESEGIKVDKKYLSHLSHEYKGKLEKLEENIFTETGEQFNISSPSQLSNILYSKLSLPTGRKTTTGYSTDDDELQRLAPLHPAISHILEYRELSKLKSTYVDSLIVLADKDKNSRIHTSYNQTRTSTGRLSSTDPNLQNIPIKTAEGRKIRKAFVAKEGYTLLGADYSQIELRILAHVTEDPGFMSAYNNHSDIHTLTASNIFGVPLDKVTPEMRRKAKEINFSIVYGAGAFNISSNLGISRGEAQQLIERFFAAYPGIKRYMEQAPLDARKNGYTETLFGRRRYVPDINSDSKRARAEAERVAINAPMQGTAADIIKIAMIHVYNDIHKKKLKSRMLLQVHDELICEVADDERDVMKGIIITRMESALKMKVPLKVEWQFGDTWDMK